MEPLDEGASARKEMWRQAPRHVESNVAELRACGIRVSLERAAPFAHVATGKTKQGIGVTIALEALLEAREKRWHERRELSEAHLR